MAWERSFEKKVMVVRDKELYYQRLNYIIEVSNSCGPCVLLIRPGRPRSTPSGANLRHFGQICR